MGRKYTVEKIQSYLNPYLKIDKIEFYGKGNDCEAFYVNNKYIFKFPKHKKANIRLQKEIKLLKNIQNIFDVEIPNVIYEGKYILNSYEFTFFASKKLNGKNMTKEEFNNLGKSELKNSADKIANFLHILHSLKKPKTQNELVLLHGDFSLDHILFQNNEVSGILDFADSRIGNYKNDFIYLLDNDDPEEFGKYFGEMVLEKYMERIKI